MKNEEVSVLRGNQITCEKALFISLSLLLPSDVAKVSVCLSALPHWDFLFKLSKLWKCELSKGKIICIICKLLNKFFRESVSFGK